MQLFSKTEQSTESKIEALQQSLTTQQAALDSLLARQAEINQQVAQAQQEASQKQAELAELQAQAEQKRQEEALDSEVRKLRPLADNVNQLSAQLAEALSAYEERAQRIRRTPPYNRANLVGQYRAIDLPYISHSEGTRHFELTTRQQCQR